MKRKNKNKNNKNNNCADKLEEQNGLRKAFTQQLLEGLKDIAELKAEVRVGMNSLDKKLDSAVKDLNEKFNLAVEVKKKVEEHSITLVRIKTIWSCLAAGIALGVSLLKDYIFGKR